MIDEKTGLAQLLQFVIIIHTAMFFDLHVHVASYLLIYLFEFSFLYLLLNNKKTFCLQFLIKYTKNSFFFVRKFAYALPEH